MNETDELIFGLIIASLGTILNLVIFTMSELEFGIIFNILYLAIPFSIGISLIIHSMKRTLKRARLELTRYNSNKVNEK